jgi:Tol biopolymer transport system component
MSSRRRSFDQPGGTVFALAVAVMVFAMGAAALTWREPRQRSSSAPGNGRLAEGRDACSVKALTKTNVDGIVVPSPDGRRYLVNKEDARGIGQIYIGTTGSTGLTCISCTQEPGGPKPDRYKTQPAWHPSGRWIFVPVERDKYSRPPILGWNKGFVKGQIRNGLWTNMWAVSPDGARWVRLTDFSSTPAGTPDGYTGPAVTDDGRKVAWSQIVDGNILKYTFGRWELMLADFEETHGTPALVNPRNITPDKMYWNEVGNFHPDNESLLLSGSVEKRAEGMDQYVLNIRTRQLINLTNTPAVWDEHGLFSPDGKKIIFMSAYPYRDDRNSSGVLTLKTEFMLMDTDGSHLTQLTHFRARGYPESNKRGVAANPVWNPDGRSAALRVLLFPDYEDWMVEFEGPCGRQ